MSAVLLLANQAFVVGNTPKFYAGATNGDAPGANTHDRTLEIKNNGANTIYLKRVKSDVGSLTNLVSDTNYTWRILPSQAVQITVPSGTELACFATGNTNTEYNQFIGDELAPSTTVPFDSAGRHAPQSIYGTAGTELLRIFEEQPDQGAPTAQVRFMPAVVGCGPWAIATGYSVYDLITNPVLSIGYNCAHTGNRIDPALPSCAWQQEARYREGGSDKMEIYWQIKWVDGTQFRPIMLKHDLTTGACDGFFATSVFSIVSPNNVAEQWYRWAKNEHRMIGQAGSDLVARMEAAAGTTPRYELGIGAILNAFAWNLASVDVMNLAWQTVVKQRFYARHNGNTGGGAFAVNVDSNRGAINAKAAVAHADLPSYVAIPASDASDGALFEFRNAANSATNSKINARGNWVPRVYTVATLPGSGNSVGEKAYASDGRALQSGGTVENAPGSGVEVQWNGSAWKIVGTNITVQA